MGLGRHVAHQRKFGFKGLKVDTASSSFLCCRLACLLGRVVLPQVVDQSPKFTRSRVQGVNVLVECFRSLNETGVTTTSNAGNWDLREESPKTMYESATR